MATCISDKLRLKVDRLRALLKPAFDSRGALQWSSYDGLKYADRLEPIVDSGSDWKITVSQAGTLVLNSLTMPIIDVDDVSAEDQEPVDRHHATFAGAQQLNDRLLELRNQEDTFRDSLFHADTSWRLYATCKGWRLIRTDEALTAAEPMHIADYVDWMLRLPADRRYADLCQTQQCFLAPG